MDKQSSALNTLSNQTEYCFNIKNSLCVSCTDQKFMFRFPKSMTCTVVALFILLKHESSAAKYFKGVDKFNQLAFQGNIISSYNICFKKSRRL